MVDLKPSWRRIAGLHMEEDGTLAAAWLAHDKETDCIHIYDACIFRTQELAVVAEGMNARGPWIPVSVEKGLKELEEDLRRLRINTLPEFYDESAKGVVVTDEIVRRTETNRLKLAEWLKNTWGDEYNELRKQETKFKSKLEGYPLMSATRHAMARLQSAKRQAPKGHKKTQKPKVAMV